MGIITERVFDEVNSIVVTTLSLPSSVVVTKATKFVRFDWRTLMHYFETLGNGLSAPWCLIRPGQTKDADWGMGTYCVYLPIEIFYVESERNIVDTTIVTQQHLGTVTPTLEVASTTGMFIGQRLCINVSFLAYVFVTEIVDATHVSVNNAPLNFTVNDGSRVFSDITSDVNCKIDLLVSAFQTTPSTPYNTFQVVTPPESDISDMNPANDLEESNYSLLAGSCYVELLVGEVISN